MTDCEHPCIPCWLGNRPDAVGSWLFNYMPLGWRHRRVMRAAMRRRRRWKEHQAAPHSPDMIPAELLGGPREAHRFRRMNRLASRQLMEIWAPEISERVIHIPHLMSLIAGEDDHA